MDLFGEKIYRDLCMLCHTYLGVKIKRRRLANPQDWRVKKQTGTKGELQLQYSDPKVKSLRLTLGHLGTSL